jgi:hypothetical protein
MLYRKVLIIFLNCAQVLGRVPFLLLCSPFPWRPAFFSPHGRPISLWLHSSSSFLPPFPCSPSGSAAPRGFFPHGQAALGGRSRGARSTRRGRHVSWRCGRSGPGECGPARRLASGGAWARLEHGAGAGERRRLGSGSGGGWRRAARLHAGAGSAGLEQSARGRRRRRAERGQGAGLVVGAGASVGGGHWRAGACAEGPDARRTCARGERRAGVSGRRWLRLGAVRQRDGVRRS